MTSRGNLHNHNSLLFLEAHMAEDTALIKSSCFSQNRSHQIRYYNTLDSVKADNMSEERRST